MSRNRLAVINELDRVLANKRLIFKSLQKLPIWHNKKKGTFICDKFMFISIDKLLVLVLVFSPSKVGFASNDQALM